jgi:hypothetical protein
MATRIEPMVKKQIEGYPWRIEVLCPRGRWKDSMAPSTMLDESCPGG